ncbi:hypothetical protein EV426DRAFT_668315 [Tirmania nivea]|nr:hypothetical protein EV426DRAFT_668315 [Tirmania nivea]
MEPLPPTFFDDLPLQYTDNAHRRRHLPYGVLLQPPLRDPLQEPVMILGGEGEGDQRVNGDFTFPAIGPATAWDCSFPGNDRVTQQHCCVRNLGYYEICKHGSLQKKHMQVEPYRKIDENNYGPLSYTPLTSKESREYMLQPRCLQKRCDRYLEFERGARIEGMCSNCKASGLTEAAIRKRAHQEFMEYLKEPLKRFQQGRNVQGSNAQPRHMNSVEDIDEANGQLNARGDEDQKFARRLGHRRQRSIFVAPWPYSPMSGLQISMHNALQSFDPSLKQHNGPWAALTYTNWGPGNLTAERDRPTDLSLGGWAIPAPSNEESHKTTEMFSNSGDSMFKLKLKPGSNKYEVMSNELETIHGGCRPKLKLKIRKSPSST